VVRDPGGEPALDGAGLIQYRMEEGLTTRDAVSEVIDGRQVLASIVMFSVIYGLLFWIWLFVLNHKIQAGPQPVTPAARTTGRGLEESAAARTIHEASLSEAKDEGSGPERRA
jgi:cytochrome d ubiquinol oxidase subunit I